MGTADWVHTENHNNRLETVKGGKKPERGRVKTQSRGSSKKPRAYVRPSPCASTRWRRLSRIIALGRLIALVQSGRRFLATLSHSPAGLGLSRDLRSNPVGPAPAPSPPQVSSFSSNRHPKLPGRVGREVQKRKQTNPQLNFPQGLTLSCEFKKSMHLKKIFFWKSEKSATTATAQPTSAFVGQTRGLEQPRPAPYRLTAPTQQPAAVSLSTG